jgi:hypothetical protein
VAVARKREKFVDELLDELHLKRSDKDCQLGQLGIFLGIWIDSHEGLLEFTDVIWEAHQLFRVHHHDPSVCCAIQYVHRREGFSIENGLRRPHAEAEVRNCYVIFRSDCAPALLCLKRGSSGSPKLQGIAAPKVQGIAERMHRTAIPR